MNYLKYGSKGPQVEHLQRLLNDNQFHRFARVLAIDGQMGTMTCAAVQAAKFWLGYDRGQMKPIAGDALLGWLSGKVPLTADMASRRKERVAREIADHGEATSRRDLRLRALEIIKGELGTIEHGDNVIKYNTWWGWGAVAYCVIGIAWSWVKAGSKAFKKGVRWANTDAMLEDAKNGRNGLHLTHEPLPGCPGVIDWDGHSNPDHGITFVKDNGDGTASTIEFNRAGGPRGLEGVWRQRDPLAQTWWFVVEK